MSRRWIPRAGRSCAVAGCKLPLHASEYCSKHYSRLARTGNAETPSTRQVWGLDAVRKKLFHGAKARAKRDGIPFSLHSSDIKIPKYCPVLGMILVKSHGIFADYSPSLDRIRPELGYVPGNVRVISWRANRIKSDSTVAELKRIVRYMRNE